jgi:acyl-CoA reductase-like NAD-dependent aldehyde dehydrogenase
MMEKFPMLINGRDVESTSRCYFPYASAMILDMIETTSMLQSVAGGERPPGSERYVYAEYCTAEQSHHAQALESAWEASQVYRNFPLERRLEFAEIANARMAMRRDALIDLLVTEGHPYRLAVWEVDGMIEGTSPRAMRFHAKDMDRQVAVPGRQVRLVRKADGVVCMSPPKNAAMSNSGLGLFILMAGNCLVVRAPKEGPLGVLYLYREIVQPALTQIGAPDGTLNVVVASAHEAVSRWLESPLVNDVLFFGSSSVGLEVGRVGYAKGKKMLLELSGNDGFTVWRDADLDRAAATLLECFLGSTQICMVPKYCLVHEDVYDAFLARMVEGARGLKLGLPSDPEVLLSPVMKIDEYFTFLQDALAKGGEVKCGGRRVDVEGRPDDAGIFIEPTVVAVRDEKVATDMLCVMEENFFPLLPVVRVTSSEGVHTEESRDRVIFAKIKAIMNANKYGLRNSFWATSEEYIARFTEEVTNGGLLKVNDSHVGFVDVLASHGGTGLTGGPFGELAYMSHRTTHLQGISRCP